MPDKVLIAYDITVMKVGCVLLQAVMGGDSGVVSELFDSRDWLLQPTPNMKLYSCTLEEASKLAEMTVKKARKLYNEGSKNASNTS